MSVIELKRPGETHRAGLDAIHIVGAENAGGGDGDVAVLSRNAPMAISLATSTLVRLKVSMVAGLTWSKRCLACGE